MPNFSTTEGMLPTPAWVVNPTTKPQKWAYDGEYFTFEPGDVVCMDQGIASHFTSHLPALEFHMTKPEGVPELKDIPPVVEPELDEETDLSDKPIGDMNYAELKVFAKQRGINSFGMKKAALVKALMA